MSIKALALAAALAVSGGSFATAATAIDPLNITAYSNSGGKLFTSIKTSSNFLSALTSAFNTSGFNSLYSTLTSTYAGIQNFQNILVTFKPVKGSGDQSWTGQLAFNTATKSVTFGSVTLLSPTQLSVQAPVAVPGPEAGAGIGALIMGGMFLWSARRRKAAQV